MKKIIISLSVIALFIGGFVFAKVVEVEDVLQVVETLGIACGDYACSTTVYKIHDINNSASCYVVRETNSATGGDNVSISCVK